MHVLLIEVFPTRYDNTPVTPLQSLSADSERLTQMEYLSCSNWRWDVPFPDPAIATALLRCHIRIADRIPPSDYTILVSQITAANDTQYTIVPIGIPRLIHIIFFPQASPEGRFPPDQRTQ